MMTIEEATATLGLASGDVSAESVERNYREKVKHCHPDRADYPGAAAEFKRATEAFDRLSQHTRGDTAGGEGASRVELARAADEFRFTTFFTHIDIWNSMPWWEKARSLLGLRFGPADTAYVPAGAPLVVRTFGRNLRRANAPVLLAPVAVEIVDLDQSGDNYLMSLHPVETERVREALERSVADGKTLEQACEELAIQLTHASRHPVHTPAERLLRAA